MTRARGPAGSPRARRARARAAALVLAMVAALGMAACTAEEPRAIVVASGADVSPVRIRQQLIDAWNAMPGNRHRQARIVELSPVADLQRSQMAGARGEYDVYNLDTMWTAEFAAAGLLEELPEPEGQDGQDFLARPMEAARYGGALMAYPFNADTGLLYYRSDLVESPPRSWPELWETARRLKAEHPELEAGYAGQFAEYEGLTVNALEIIWGGGGDVLAGGKVVLSGPRNEESLKALAAQIGTTIPREVLDHREADGLRMFAERKVAFLRHWPYAYHVLRGDEKAPPFKVAALPRPPQGLGTAARPSATALGGQNLAVAKGSPRRDDAIDLIRFLTGQHCQRRLMREGGFAPTRHSVYDYPWGEVSGCGGNAADGQPRNAGALPVLERCTEASHTAAACQEWEAFLREVWREVDAARARPALPSYQRFSEVFRREVHRALVAGRPPDIARLSAELAAAATGR
ncbi:extracellular solute-binding protein [Bailinhaonella thermotolerans]|uniref:Extracellular solute-binding protein n=1 Tax=Bailinhaonella thermotolerans TaxID=1070861 RepID=A0A3A4B1J5_9ACTN|nr:extracellular solute-binding protein [Bailinhaonella thermotolerans]RJL31280.1 extracellular solute-binding protein [Bailinhaonella thermotolerans]